MMDLGAGLMRSPIRHCKILRQKDAFSTDTGATVTNDDVTTSANDLDTGTIVANGDITVSSSISILDTGASVINDNATTSNPNLNAGTTIATVSPPT